MVKFVGRDRSTTSFGAQNPPVFNKTWPVVPVPVKFRTAWLTPPLVGVKHTCVIAGSEKSPSGPSSANCSVYVPGVELVRLPLIVATQPTVPGFQEEPERERGIPPLLVQQLRSAGFYSLVVPREVGGLEVDLVTFLRVAELMAEADGSVGWNLANSAIQQLIALSLPQAGVNEIYKDGPDTIIAGTAVPGGGRAVEVEGGYGVP